MTTLSHILLVDDHPLFCKGLRLVLEIEFPCASIHEAHSLEEALALTIVPCLIMLDIKLQNLNGLECIAIFKRYWSSTPIIIVSALDELANAQLAQDKGAITFISKAESADNIISAINKHLISTQQHIPPLIQQPRLTPRQYQVLHLLQQGLPNKSIGRKLNLSENTVRAHVQAVLLILQVSSRSEAAFVARRKGLIF